ncbi:LPS O-antigen length regulator Wzz(fepE) [Enterobacter roggenkampii]|uniref:LPS O-antigen length regulator Wzz(fepE) n=1 Tax=Enterobacter roggenkampii TaxID=1812935 RepID=UPI002DBE6799|nr:LPS O-antigen length regulator Wzz(fepE) [Enterobacter roggenkampii]MEB5887496.1 LPS O-antigen length regulator Wzz(fepE) [Enterobacter roggenkampii]
MQKKTYLINNHTGNHSGAEHNINCGLDDTKSDHSASSRTGYNFLQPPAEIDLLSLLFVFWRARRLITFCVVFSALAGVAISVLFPHKWTSSAIITPVDSNQWTQLQLSLITAQTLGVRYSIDRSSAFDLFINNFQAQHLTEEYLKVNPTLLRKYSRTLPPSRDFNRAVNSVFSRIKALPMSGEKNSPPPVYRSWKLSFTGPDPQSAQDTLRGYIGFVTDKTTSQLQLELYNTLLLKIDTEKKELALAFAELQNNHRARIQRLSYALQIAEAAGITTPLYSRGQSMNDDPDYSVALGTKGLTSKLNIEKSLTDLKELNPELSNRKYRLEQLEKITIRSPNFPVFRYQMAPSFPNEREGPGLMLILILGSLLGGIAGGTYVLIHNTIASRKQQL